MIFTINSHGRTRRDVERLAAHLSNTTYQSVSISKSFGVVAANSLHDQLIDLAASRYLSKKANIGIQHITINPRIIINSNQKDRLIDAIRKEFNAENHAYVLVEHSGKTRARLGGSTIHYHLLIAHVSPNGKALNISHSYDRLEAIARSAEYSIEGGHLTPSRRRAKVAVHLDRRKEHQVAAKVREGDQTLPESRMSTRSRQRAKREGINLPARIAEIEQLWRAGDPLSALRSKGFKVRLGDQKGVILIETASGSRIGALHRLLKKSKAEVIAKIECNMNKEKGNVPNANLPARERSNSARNTRKRQDNKGNDGGIHADYGCNRGGLPSTRNANEERSKVRYVTECFTTTRIRGRKHLNFFFRSEIALRLKRHRGVIVVDQLQEIQAQLWEKIVGSRISPNVAATIAYVQVGERLALLMNGGWVRDAGEKIFASSADPVVVSVWVASIQAKGWTMVKIWGDPEFLKEARSQLAQAGIDVVEDEPPSTETILKPNMRLISEVRQRFSSELADAKNTVLARKLPTTPSLFVERAQKALESAKRKLADAMTDYDAAKTEYEKSIMEVTKSRFLRRGQAQRRAKAAEDALKRCNRNLSDVRSTVANAESWLNTTQTAQNKRIETARKEFAARDFELLERIRLLDEAIRIVDRSPVTALRGTMTVLKLAAARLDRSNGIDVSENINEELEHSTTPDSSVMTYGR